MKERFLPGSSIKRIWTNLGNMQNISKARSMYNVDPIHNDQYSQGSRSKAGQSEITASDKRRISRTAWRKGRGVEEITLCIS